MIMCNCSPHIEWNSEILPHLTYFMQRLKYCHYYIYFRHKVLSKAMKIYDLRMQNLLEGKSYVLKDNTAKTSQETRNDWYKEGEKYESVLFVEATPHSEYKSKVEVLVKKHDLKIKVVEIVGQTVNHMLQRSNPFQNNISAREDCIICTKGLGINYRERGCVYEFSCLDCEGKRKYRGKLVEVYMNEQVST